MATDNPECPLCGSAKPKAFLKDWKTWRWWDCTACGVAFVTPFENPGEGFYSDYQDMYPHAAAAATDPMSFEYDECLSSLGPSESRRLLDVGCGAGGFLYRAKQAGFSVAGLDFNAKRVTLVADLLRTPDVFLGGLPAFASSHPDARIDVVTMFQILEHLDEPAAWLSAASKLLKPGGRLFIGTPNRDRTFDPFKGPGMDQVDNPPHHLTRWRASALKRFVEGCGLRVLEIHPLAVPLPLFSLMLRNSLRFGLATKALATDQLQHAAPAAASSASSSLLRSAVKLKELLINALALLIYPFYRLACPLFGWQGVVLYCVAEPKAQASA